MSYKKATRVERSVVGGIMLKRDELQQILEQQNDRTSEYRTDAQSYIDAVASRAKEVGKSACIASCQLECSGISLFDTVTDYDADITLRCIASVCTNDGIEESLVYIRSEIEL